MLDILANYAWLPFVDVLTSRAETVVNNKVGEKSATSPSAIANRTGLRGDFVLTFTAVVGSKIFQVRRRLSRGVKRVELGLKGSTQGAYRCVI